MEIIKKPTIISKVNGVDTYYNSVLITSGKLHYHFLQVTGYLEMVAITNMNSPWKSLGKQFKSFDDAQESYKMPKLKSMILMAEVNLK
jgi:hypothetical protein